mmetsp:Transcript_13353/g.56454  ORF Transcript_13353/g.56454 Transcript_13353/m.56454 type:complete len:222 (+) Transcript_13353:618-1283(+)
MVLQLWRLDGKRRGGQQRSPLHRDPDPDRAEERAHEARAQEVHDREQLLQDRGAEGRRAGQRRPAHRRGYRRVFSRGGVSVRPLVQTHPRVHPVPHRGGEGIGLFQAPRAVRRADFYHHGASPDGAKPRQDGCQGAGARGRVPTHAREVNRACRRSGAARRCPSRDWHLGRWFEEPGGHTALARAAADPQERRGQREQVSGVTRGLDLRARPVHAKVDFRG